jgi:hypothetical protein
MLVGRLWRLWHHSLPGGVVLEVFAGGGHLHSSEIIHFCACLCLASSASSCVGHQLVDALSPLSLLAETLPPLYSDGCFAAAVLVGDCSGGCFAAVVGWSGGCFGTLLCCRPSHLDVVVFFSRHSFLVLARCVGSG